MREQQVTTRYVRRVQGLVTVLVTAALLVASPGPPAAATTGPDSYRCSDFDGRIAHRQLIGDLVLDGSCLLEQVHVTGSLLGGADAGPLGLHDSTVDGDVRSTSNINLYGSLVRGGVVSDAGDGGGVNIRDSSVRRSVRGQAETLGVFSSGIGGALTFSGTEWSSVWDSSVAGTTTLRGVHGTLFGSTFGSGLTWTGASYVTVLCGVAVTGDLTLSRAHWLVHVGTYPADAGGECPSAWPSAVTVGGTLRLLDTPHTIRLGDVTVAGDLVCTGNTGPGGIQGVGGVAVGGVRSGQCAS